MKTPIIRKISLQNFKNYRQKDFEFEALHTLILGRNGIGKSNLLDAIYFLSLTKSAFHSDRQLILHGETFCKVESFWQEGNSSHKLVAIYAPPERKRFILDDYLFPSLAEYIGRFPVVLIAPNDTDLIREGSEERRRLVDAVLCQTDKTYLQELSNYQYLLKQRNAILSQELPLQEMQNLLEAYNQQILPLMRKIATKRRNFVFEIQILLQKIYAELSQSTKQACIAYRTQCLEVNFEEVFQQSWQKDVALQRTSQGIHKDDFEFLLESRLVKKFGSQGEQKTFIIALKMAIFEFLQSRLQTTPILLLDDILDKLDEVRIFQLLQRVTQQPFGQVIVTEAHAKRLEQMLAVGKWQKIVLE